jgi:hypothetical protein
VRVKEGKISDLPELVTKLGISPQIIWTLNYRLVKHFQRG